MTSDEGEKSLGKPAVVRFQPALPPWKNTALQVSTEESARKAQSPRLSRAIDGQRHQEIADELDVSLTTVENDLRMGRAWLRRELTGRSIGADGR
jgi:DNA-directed RNA polymerase specialized sigma24 family protein